MSKRAIILCGGKGVRLKPYTVVLPKPLMPIGDYPVLEVVVRQLAKNGFDHITMAVGYQADLIRAFFDNGSKWNIKIDYSMENEPLGTMGPLKLIKDLPENFLIMNGDLLTDLNFGEFFDHHAKNKNLFTISSFIVPQRSEYGILEVGQGGKLAGFEEKPVTEHEVSMGIYMVSRKVLKYIPGGKPYSFPDLMFDLMKRKTPATVKRHKGSWLDIGNPEEYSKAIDLFEKKKELYLK